MRFASFHGIVEPGQARMLLYEDGDPVKVFYVDTEQIPSPEVLRNAPGPPTFAVTTEEGEVTDVEYDPELSRMRQHQIRQVIHEVANNILNSI